MYLPAGRFELVEGAPADSGAARPESVSVRRIVDAEFGEPPVGSTGVAGHGFGVIALVPVLKAVPQNREMFEQLVGGVRKSGRIDGWVEVLEGSYKVARGHEAEVSIGAELPEWEPLFIAEVSRDALPGVGLRADL